MKRIETRFNNWRYFGYDRETFLHYQGELFQNNLKRSYQHAIMLLLVCVMSLPLFLFVDHNPANVIAVVLEMALSFLLASWARRLRHSSATPQVRSINALVICVSLSCYLCSIFVSCVGNGNDLAVTAIWVILVVQFIYIQPAIQNLLISFPCLLVLMACSLLVKTPDKSVYDCVHAFITFVIGQYVSWFNTRSRLDLIIASDKLRHVNYALYHASVTDTLTGLDNRKLIFAKYKELSAKCADDNSKMACIVIDADNFKAYNDLYGHPAGDDLLSTLGKFFNQFAEAKHLNVGRIGGEEFMAIWQPEEGADPREIAEALRGGVEALGIPHTASSAADIVTISLGLYVDRPDMQERRDGLYYWADRALYRAKDHGKNCCWQYIREKQGYALSQPGVEPRVHLEKD